MATILAATRDGLHRLDGGGARLDVRLEGRSITSLARSGSDVWGVADRSVVWRMDGEDLSTVTALTELDATCITAIGGVVYLGTSEARLFRLRGTSLDPLETFDTVAGRSSWFTPWGGPPATRSIANWDADIYVNVHVGGIVHTDDEGQTWTPTIQIEADVHHVTTFERLVLAACARGLAVSEDRGATWRYRSDGLDAIYSRAVTVCGDVLLLSSSEGPRGGRAAIYRAPVAGGSFEPSRNGLPDRFEGNIDTYCLESLPDGSFATVGTADGGLWASTDQGGTWDQLATDLPAVQRVLVMP